MISRWPFQPQNVCDSVRKSCICLCFTLLLGGTWRHLVFLSYLFSMSSGHFSPSLQTSIFLPLQQVCQMPFNLLHLSLAKVPFISWQLQNCVLDCYPSLNLVKNVTTVQLSSYRLPRWNLKTSVEPHAALSYTEELVGGIVGCESLWLTVHGSEPRYSHRLSLRNTACHRQDVPILHVVLGKALHSYLSSSLHLLLAALFFLSCSLVVWG